MPSSRAIVIPYVINIIRQVQPSSILDVGVGFGKWGYLFREYTDINASENDPGRYKKENWKVRIEGIEIFSSYLHAGHDFIYDKIHVGNVEDVLPSLGTYDLIFMGDVLEHLTKICGENLLRIAKNHFTKCLIITTPRYETEQKDSCDNPFEEHKSLWGPKDFRKIGSCLIKVAQDKATFVVAYPTPEMKNLEIDLEVLKPNFFNRFFKGR